MILHLKKRVKGDYEASSFWIIMSNDVSDLKRQNSTESL